MRKLTDAFAIMLLAATCACAKTTETDWCIVDHPESWDYLTATNGFDVKVTLKEGAPVAGNWLQPHLHWMRINGYGGFSSWMPPKKTPEVGKTYTFHYKPKVEENVTHRYSFCAFLSENANDKTKAAEVWAEIKIPPPPPYEPKPEGCNFKKSFIRIDETPAPARVGDEITLKVHYYLDPSETWGPKPSRLAVTPLGPWIDNPDGVINKKRTHVSYGGSMYTKEVVVEPGEHDAEFKFKLGTAYRYNSCFFLCKFKQPDFKDWPWDYRGGSLTVIPTIDYFRLTPTARGGLFYYDETPEVALQWGDKARGGLVTGHAVVKDVHNTVVLEKDVKLNPARRIQTITFPELKKRGIFSLTVKAPGMGTDGAEVEDFCYFGTIPRFQRQGAGLTPFGVTNIGDLDLSELAYDLGFSMVRHFTGWSGIEPMRGKFALGSLDRSVANNNAAGLKAWIQLYSPPAWALPPHLATAGQFEPSPFNLDDWAATIDFLAKRYAGKLYGFEFMNEIVPGKACEDPVKTYVDICRVGYETVKKNDPNLVCQLAGGLWPHTYRVDLLNSGVAKYIDVLPVHYSTFEGVREAQKDLAIRGIKNVRVADNETASGYSVWNYPPDMAFDKSLGQCRHVMTRWPDELCAGAEFITYFGGGGDACGNWSYMLDITSPRPVAATLAVVQGCLAYAKPVGKFYLGETVCHLFEKDAKAILFMATSGKNGVEVQLPANGELSVTDFQGNVTKVADGKVVTGDMPVIVEGADLDALKLHASLMVGTANSPTALPQCVADAGDTVSFPVEMTNPYGSDVKFTVVPSAPSWGSAKAEEVTLKAGETKTIEMKYVRNGDAPIPPANSLECAVSAEGVGRVVKPFSLFVADSSSIGNLVKNGTFEGTLDPWKGNGVAEKVAVPGNADNGVLAIHGVGKGYRHHHQSVKVPVPGGEYLYSAWLRGDGMGGGSNLDEYDASGKHLKNYMMLRIFTIPGSGTKGWNYLSKVIKTLPETASVDLTPVAEGKEGAKIMYDNIQFSRYRGSDFVAFASADAKTSSLIPLLCENQLRAEEGYAFSEKNLAGIAQFTWSAKSLVFDVVVEDDKLDIAGDSIDIAIFPRTGPDGNPANDQLRWHISMESPGGGSGKFTVYRPKEYSMGGAFGQLCKDSSVYDIDIKRTDTVTHYRFTMPWSEITGFTPAEGASFGCNIVLNDRDGGKERGSMVWGAGMKEFSSGCGLIELVK